MPIVSRWCSGTVIREQRCRNGKGGSETVHTPREIRQSQIVGKHDRALIDAIGGNHLKGKARERPPAIQIQRNGGWVTEKDINSRETTQYLASVAPGNLPPPPFNIRMRRMKPDWAQTSCRTKRSGRHTPKSSM